MDSRIVPDSSEAATGSIIHFAGGSSSPAWASIHRDILCPLCDYNLRGLIDPRCPECGHQFDWGPLLNPTNNTHAYLFEHHPEKNVRSFIRTAIGTLNPRKFWSDLRADQAVRTRRLMAYWMICNLVPLILGVGWLISNRMNYTAPVYSFSSLPPRGPYTGKRFPHYGTDFCVVDLTSGHDFIVGVFLSACAANILFSVLLFGGLIAFRASMRQARIKYEQVMRCVVYSTDAVFWIGVLLLVGLLISILARFISPPQFNDYAILENDFTNGIAPTLPYILAFVVGYRLSTAYSRYLSFRHPVATVLSVQFILLLIALVIRTFVYIKQMGG